MVFINVKEKIVEGIRIHKGDVQYYKTIIKDRKVGKLLLNSLYGSQAYR